MKNPGFNPNLGGLFRGLVLRWGKGGGKITPTHPQSRTR